jgi:hypothetical protein
LNDFPLDCSLLFLWIFLRFAFFWSCLRKWPGECCSWVRKEDDLIDLSFAFWHVVMILVVLFINLWEIFSWFLWICCLRFEALDACL